MIHPSISTLLVHPHPLEREAIATWFDRNPILVMAGKVKDLTEPLALKYLREIDLIILFDYGSGQLPARIVEIKRVHPAIKFLILTSNMHTSDIQDLVRAGIHGYLELTSETDELEDAIRAVAKGQVYYSQTAMLKLAEGRSHTEAITVQPAFCNVLSKRELEVLGLVANEYSTVQIADNLFISAKTVETHRRNLFQKLGVKNAIGLAKVALRLGVA